MVKHKIPPYLHDFFVELSFLDVLSVVECVREAVTSALLDAYLKRTTTTKLFCGRQLQKLKCHTYPQRTFRASEPGRFDSRCRTRSTACGVNVSAAFDGKPGRSRAVSRTTRAVALHNLLRFMFDPQTVTLHYNDCHVIAREAVDERYCMEGNMHSSDAKRFRQLYLPKNIPVYIWQFRGTACT